MTDMIAISSGIDTKINIINVDADTSSISVDMRCLCIDPHYAFVAAQIPFPDPAIDYEMPCNNHLLLLTARDEPPSAEIREY